MYASLRHIEAFRHWPDGMATAATNAIQAANSVAEFVALSRTTTASADDATTAPSRLPGGPLAKKLSRVDEDFVDYCTQLTRSRCRRTLQRIDDVAAIVEAAWSPPPRSHLPASSAASPASAVATAHNNDSPQRNAPPSLPAGYWCVTATHVKSTLSTLLGQLYIDVACLLATSMVDVVSTEEGVHLVDVVAAVFFVHPSQLLALLDDAALLVRDVATRSQARRLGAAKSSAASARPTSSSGHATEGISDDDDDDDVAAAANADTIARRMNENGGDVSDDRDRLHSDNTNYALLVHRYATNSLWNSMSQAVGNSERLTIAQAEIINSGYADAVVALFHLHHYLVLKVADYRRSAGKYHRAVSARNALKTLRFEHLGTVAGQEGTTIATECRALALLVGEAVASCTAASELAEATARWAQHATTTHAQAASASKHLKRATDHLYDSLVDALAYLSELTELSYTVASQRCSSVMQQLRSVLDAHAGSYVPLGGAVMTLAAALQSMRSALLDEVPKIARVLPSQDNAAVVALSKQLSSVAEGAPATPAAVGNALRLAFVHAWLFASPIAPPSAGPTAPSPLVDEPNADSVGEMDAADVTRRAILLSTALQTARVAAMQLPMALAGVVHALKAEYPQPAADEYSARYGVPPSPSTSADAHTGGPPPGAVCTVDLLGVMDAHLLLLDDIINRQLATLRVAAETASQTSKLPLHEQVAVDKVAPQVSTENVRATVRQIRHERQAALLAARGGSRPGEAALLSPGGALTTPEATPQRQRIADDDAGVLLSDVTASPVLALDVAKNVAVASSTTTRREASATAALAGGITQPSRHGATLISQDERAATRVLISCLDLFDDVDRDVRMLITESAFLADADDRLKAVIQKWRAFSQMIACLGKALYLDVDVMRMLHRDSAGQSR